MYSVPIGKLSEFVPWAELPSLKRYDIKGKNNVHILSMGAMWYISHIVYDIIIIITLFIEITIKVCYEQSNSSLSS